MNFFYKHHRLLFYSSWLVLALVQSASTELIADEAYYWVYSKFPAWGYFDHPPMIAVLIKAGDTIFHNELGVRLICALLSTFTIIITESLIERKQPFVFYTIVLSIGILQVAGFLSVPDTPLLFFTALFFYVYRLFIKIATWKNTFFLAIAITLLFYTKYHGLLIVFFAVLSNIKLLRRWQLWAAALLVFILYSPHLYWQWQHDWISFRYHLFESNVSTYKFSYTTDYFLGQLLLSGPLAGFILLPAAFLYKPKTSFEKALKFVMIGIYGTFLFSSFRGKVEANWTMPALIPLVILSHQFILEKTSWFRPLRMIAFVSLVLIIAGRLYLVIDLGPDNSFKGRFHNNDVWAKAIKEKTGNSPVVFYNSYQRASLYWFYSGLQSHSHNAYWERRNNYNFWPTEETLLGKKVVVADIYSINNFSDSVQTRKGVVGLSADSIFAALGAIRIIPDQKNIGPLDLNMVHLKLTSQFSRRYSDFVRSHPAINAQLVAGVFKGKELVKEFDLKISAMQLVTQTTPFEVTLMTLPKGSDAVRFGIKSNGYPVTHNSEKINLLGF